MLIDFPEDYSDVERIQLQEELIIIVMKMLIKHENLYYYQVRENPRIFINESVCLFFFSRVITISV